MGDDKIIISTNKTQKDKKHESKQDGEIKKTSQQENNTLYKHILSKAENMTVFVFLQLQITEWITDTLYIFTDSLVWFCFRGKQRDNQMVNTTIRFLNNYNKLMNLTAHYLSSGSIVLTKHGERAKMASALHQEVELQTEDKDFLRGVDLCERTNCWINELSSRQQHKVKKRPSDRCTCESMSQQTPQQKPAEVWWRWRCSRMINLDVSLPAQLGPSEPG